MTVSPPAEQAVDAAPPLVAVSMSDTSTVPIVSSDSSAVLMSSAEAVVGSESVQGTSPSTERKLRRKVPEVAVQTSSCTSASPGTIGSWPTGQVRRLQSWPCHPSSHAHPYTLSASHVSGSLATAPYSKVLGSPLSVAACASSRMLRHRPCPEHGVALHSERGHDILSQAAPSNPSAHRHSPVALSHAPRSLHSASVLCASLAAEGASNQDRPTGQVRSTQAAPVKPSAQVQR
mmetsp:Transcript_13201/g.42120  ORF Transcript_13201/g.42120 Transcript_13201/m.42120 type:complete len:233 (+) Transcript_13201:711-1409(+)